jgi:hypothetical protein
MPVNNEELNIRKTLLVYDFVNISMGNSDE